MEKMPEYKEGFITLWKDGVWIQVPVSEMAKVVSDDNAKMKLAE